MVDAQILKDFNSDNAAIRKVFTCDDPRDPAYEIKKAFEKKISARLFSGWTNSLQNSHLYSASDLAWDAAPIVRENIPLLLYAQKKIKIDRCASELEACGCSEQFVRKDTDGTIKEIDLPRLYEVSVNLVRSYLTRRLAPQAVKYNKLYPFFKYEPRATDLVGKLRADALSQRVEIMADQYNYRHLMTQAIRDVLLYGRTVLFPACAWDREVQWRKAPLDDAFQNGKTYKVESVVTREGVDFIRPHPSRVFWDMTYPLSSVNTNSGVTYVGFWDIRKYYDILHNSGYFNRDKIRVSTKGRDFYSSYRLYFDTQYNSQRIKFSTLADLRAIDPAAGNDILAAAPYYQGTEVDESIFVTEYYERVIPNQNAMGDYPFPVWLRLVVASDDTIVFGEFLTTSVPAIYFGFNENDNRSMNISMAHEIMPFQDQISNLLSQLLLTAKANAFQMITLDTDCVDDAIRTELKKTLKGDKYYVSPLMLEYSGNKVRNLGVNAINPIQFLEKRATEDINNYFRSITQLLSIIERMMVLSPQELGQVAKHEISATEVNEIASSTSTVYDYISDALDEGRSAWKKFVYEALVNKATADVPIPVKERYTPEVVAAAGFKIVDNAYSDPSDAQMQITGAKEKLIHDYAFNSRDGAERSSNVQSANTLVQLLGNVVNIPGVLQAMGKTKLYEIINEIFRLSGAGYDLKLQVAPGEDPSFGPDPQEAQQQAQQAIQQVMQEVQKLAQEVQKAEQQNESTQQQVQETNTQVSALLQAIEQIGQQHQDAVQAHTELQQSAPPGMPMPPPPMPGIPMTPPAAPMLPPGM